MLAERDWKFAKTRVELQQSSSSPLYAYNYAYALPADYLRLVRPRPREDDRRLWWSVGTWPYEHDWPVSPPWVDPYIIETVNGVMCLLTDHNNDVYPLYINYIKLITDMTILTPAFVNSLTNRLCAELAIAITEDKQKSEGFMTAYRNSLNTSSALNEQADYLHDEAGGHEWVRAGRFVTGRYW